MGPHPQSTQQHNRGAQTPPHPPVWQQQTHPAVPVPPAHPPVIPAITPLPLQPIIPASSSSKRIFITRFILIGIIAILAFAIYMVWHTTPSTTPPTSTQSGVITQQNFSGNTSPASNTSSATSSTTGNTTIQVYIVGAVKHPGVYLLASGARVFQLIQAAGGSLPKANLVALNLAAKLSDGQEVYVTVLGEVPPTYMGGVSAPSGSSTQTTGTTQGGVLVNINTASADELRLSLHVSSTTAQNIVSYRLQHGNYTSVDQLLQVVSKSIYSKIKDSVSIS